MVDANLTAVNREFGTNLQRQYTVGHFNLLDVVDRRAHCDFVRLLVRLMQGEILEVDYLATHYQGLRQPSPPVATRHRLVAHGVFDDHLHSGTHNEAACTATCPRAPELRYVSITNVGIDTLPTPVHLRSAPDLPNGFLPPGMTFVFREVERVESLGFGSQSIVRRAPAAGPIAIDPFSVVAALASMHGLSPHSFVDQSQAGPWHAQMHAQRPLSRSPDFLSVPSTRPSVW